MSMISKPRVVQKVHDYVRKVRKNGNKVGKIPRSLTINYNNLCNFKCDFCYSTEASHEHAKMHLDDDTIKRVADEADSIGIWELVLLGGELLINISLFMHLLELLGTDRFQIVLITNGYYLTSDVANNLSEAGVDCIGVSISSLNEQEHNSSRGGIKDAHKKALAALDNAAAAGMNAWPNVIFGHHNSHSDELYEFMDYLKQKQYTTYLIMAMPFGSWKDNRMDSEDLKILGEFRKKYDCCFDTWDMYDNKKERISGCWTVNRTYLTPLGDVLVCPYMNIKIGNVKEQSLKDILDFGFSIKYFGNYSPVCISAFNSSFRDKYLNKEADLFSPLEAKEIFGKDDYIVDDNSNLNP